MVATFTCRLLYEIICSVILTKVTLTSAAFLSAPKDTVALVGARVELECRTNVQNLSLRWSYYASNNPRRLISLFNGRTIPTMFKSTYDVEANPNSGRYNLIIKAAGFPNAGEYTCAEDAFAERAAIAFLTVLASDPVCDTDVNPLFNGTIENDELWAWCMVTYIGSGIPLMKWTINSTGNVASSETVNSTDAMSTFTSKVKMQVTSSASGLLISCMTILELHELSERPHYDRTLNYTHIWNHRANVLYGPKNLKITPLSSILGISESLLCWADGNPSPIYEWTNVETGRIIGVESVLTLEETVTSFDKEYTFQCTAANILATHKTSKLLIIRPTTLIDKASTGNTNEAEGNTGNTASTINTNETQERNETQKHRKNETQETQETLMRPTLSLLVIVIGPSAVALILILIIAILLISKAYCKATEGPRSVDGNQEVSRLDNRPIIQVELEVNPYSEVDADQCVEPNESLNAGLDAIQGHIHEKAMVEPYQEPYTELSARHGIRAQQIQEKEAYTQLRVFVNAASSGEYADYMEIP